MLDDPILAGWAFAAITAAIVVIAAWLAFPRGREPGLGRPALVFGVTFVALPFYSALLAVPVAMGAAMPPQVGALWIAFIGAAIPEEAYKGLVVWALAIRGRPVRMIQDGAFYGVVAGMAFGLIENLAYIFHAGRAATIGADQVAFLRVVAAAPMHAAAAALLGHALVVAAASPPERRTRVVAWGFLAAVGLHGGYDAALMLGEARGDGLVSALAVPFLIGGIVAAAASFLQARRLDDRRLRARRTP